MGLYKFAKSQGLFLLRERNYWLIYNTVSGKIVATYFENDKNLVAGEAKVKCGSVYEALARYIDYNNKQEVNHAIRSTQSIRI